MDYITFIIQMNSINEPVELGLTRTLRYCTFSDWYISMEEPQPVSDEDLPVRSLKLMYQLSASSMKP